MIRAVKYSSVSGLREEKNCRIVWLGVPRKGVAPPFCGRANQAEPRRHTTGDVS